MPASSKGKFVVHGESVSWVLYESGVLKIKPSSSERFMVKLKAGEDPTARAKNEYATRSRPLPASASRSVVYCASGPADASQSATSVSATTVSDGQSATIRQVQLGSLPSVVEPLAPLAPQSKARNTGYYYAAVPTSERVLPTSAPTRIGTPSIAERAAGGAL
mmetsp:Transcript_16000/g.44992  ORF Transcript_16000/g.44992 Transcript_16000/m.44992 type:complete len:163 (+) Transcript_16000:181-669(+)